MAESLTSHAGWVDRRGATRTVPMKVLVLGYPRTGTASMRAALKILGYNDVHHMQAVFANPPEADMWMEAIMARFFGQGKPFGKDEWDQLLGHCEAVTDAPAAMFAEDLIAAYPEAKVILTNREPEKWWKSFTESIGSMVTSPQYRFAAYLDPHGLGKVAALGKLVLSVIVGPSMAEAGAKARFTGHYSQVRKMVPSDRLLEYEVNEGWGPLCTFLDKDVPPIDFPKTNDTKMVRERLRAIVRATYRRFALQTVLPCVLLTGVAFAIYASRFRARNQ